MKKFNLNINDMVAVRYKDMVYKCIVEDISDENVWINIPVNESGYLFLDKGERLEGEYLSSIGTLYEFKFEILLKEKINDIPMYKLSLPFDIKKIQRRNHVRVPVVKAAQFRLDEKGAWNKAIILDISGGGVRIKTPNKLNEGDKLFIKIEANEEVLNTAAIVKRNEGMSSSEYSYGLEFIDIDEGKRDKIVKEVFLVMRKQRETI